MIYLHHVETNLGSMRTLLVADELEGPLKLSITRLTSLCVTRGILAIYGCGAPRSTTATGNGCIDRGAMPKPSAKRSAPDPLVESYAGTHRNRDGVVVVDHFAGTDYRSICRGADPSSMCARLRDDSHDAAPLFVKWKPRVISVMTRSRRGLTRVGVAGLSR